jgi:ribosomal protein L31
MMPDDIEPSTPKRAIPNCIHPATLIFTNYVDEEHNIVSADFAPLRVNICSGCGGTWTEQLRRSTRVDMMLMSIQRRFRRWTRWLRMEQ